MNGVNGLFLQIQKTSDASEVDASNNVLAALPRAQTQFPEIDFAVINVQSKYTEQQLDSVMRTLLEGVVLTGIVMLFFLHSWRNAIVVLIAIPASLGVALFVMKMLGLDARHDLAARHDDRRRHPGRRLDRRFGKYRATSARWASRRRGRAITGRTEIGVAAIVITLVDVVVFLPISFIQSQIGHILSEFAIVVVIATLTSLFVCFTDHAVAGRPTGRSSRPGNRGGSSTRSPTGSTGCASWYTHTRARRGR